ncbi:MAG: TetR/AcrR family transcriptional regulator [Nocardioidaceae bacterium]
MSVAQGSTDPRIERSQAVIRRAALIELSEVGYGSLTIEAVAGRAGVGKSTIYRHWAGKPALVIDALERLNEQPRPESDDASPPERVERLVRHFAEVSVDPVVSGCLVALIDAAERDPELRRLHHRYSAQRRQTLVTAIADGVAAGDFASQTDPELASLALIGAVLYRRVMTDDPIDPDRIAGLIGLVLGGPDFEQR